MLVRTLLAAMALALAVAGSSGRAGAQCRLCTTPTTAPEADTTAPVALQVDANLDFDRIVLAGSGEGSATLGPDGSRRTSGTIVSIGGRAMVGSIMVRGEPGRAVAVTLPGRIALHGLTGSDIVIDSVTSNLPGAPRIGADGTLAFRIGGALHVTGDVDGDYRGDFSVDVDYL
ncbi:MAG: DUF4402 domain-containing protein [Sphingomicrobium sp.]